GLAVVGRIGPRAVGRERESAEAIAATRAGLRREIGLAGIDVGDGERSAGEDVACDDIDVLGHVTGAHAADYRHVVGAVDGDGDDPAGRAIARDRGEAVGERLAGTELLDRRLAVVSRISPRAVGREREGAEAIAAGRAGLRREIGLAGIAVVFPYTSLFRSVACDDIDVLGHVTGAHAADYRHLVGAVD